MGDSSFSSGEMGGSSRESHLLMLNFGHIRCLSSLCSILSDSMDKGGEGRAAIAWRRKVKGIGGKSMQDYSVVAGHIGEGP